MGNCQLKYFALFLLIGTSVLVHAQSMKFKLSKEDIWKQYNEADTNEGKADALCKMGLYFWKKDYQPDSSLYYWEKMLEYCEKEQYFVGMIPAHKFIGRHYTRHHELDRGYKHLQRSLFLSDSLNFKKDIGHLYYAFGHVHMTKNQYDSSYFYYQKGLELTDTSDHNILADIHTSLGINLGVTGDFKKAETNYLKAKDYHIQLKDTLAIYVIYTSLMSFYSNTYPSPKKFAEYYQKLSELNSSMGLDLKSYHVNTFPIDSLSYKDQLSFLTEAIDNLIEVDFMQGILDGYHKLALVHFNNNQYGEAKRTVLSAINFIKKQKVEDLEYEIDFLKLKYKIDSLNGDFENALTTLSYYNTLRDSITRQNNYKQVRELNIQYETAIKEKQIIESKLQIDKSTNQRNLFLLTSLLLVSIGGFYWKRTQQKNKLVQQEKELQEQKIAQFEKEKKILSLAAMLEGQEAERIRIAKDLHDGLGGLLSTVKAHFGKVQGEIKKLENLKIYKKATGMIDEACDEVRRVSHNLMPGVLRASGLQSAVKQLVNTLEDTHGLEIDFETSGMEERFSKSEEVFIYRIIQELSNNIIKHANAKQVLIQMIASDGVIQIVVEDDGRGFLYSNIKKKEGLGLRSIYSRVNYLNGTIDIDSNLGKGTTITINIPILSNNKIPNE